VVRASSMIGLLPLAIDLPLFPKEASVEAGKTDMVFFFLVGVSLFFTALIFTLIFVFVVKYRRRSSDEVAHQVKGGLLLELAWIFIPLAITMVMFTWGATVFFDSRRPPAGTLDIHVVGKQWMWKFQHPGGQMEIDDLHVPVGRPVRLIMTSQDVIHSLFIPAFRIKQDVLPGRYKQQWFTATRPGTYHLFCTQYCGTGHSAMIGTVHVLEPAAFEAWLAGETSGGSLAALGERLFTHYLCSSCHRNDTLARAPDLVGLYGKQVLLSDGGTVIADEDYIRESILASTAKVVSGWEPIMPLFKGVIPEEEVAALVAYVKSLSGGGTK
jgi:cytochrome c oxidase subunit II